jgi:hypothetical protein
MHYTKRNVCYEKQQDLPTKFDISFDYLIIHL